MAGNSEKPEAAAAPPVVPPPAEAKPTPASGAKKKTVVYTGLHNSVECAGMEWVKDKPEVVDVEIADYVMTNEDFKEVTK